MSAAKHTPTLSVKEYALTAQCVALREKNNALAKALDECATRFERCCIHSGSDKGFAAHAVEDYRAMVKAAKGEA